MTHLYPKLLVSNYADINGRIPDINRGGCGIFAEELYNTLIKLGNKPQIYIITRFNINDVLEAIANDNTYGFSFNHIIIKIGKYYYDSNGKRTIEDYRDIYGSNISFVNCSIEYLNKLNANIDVWNDTFNRNKTKNIQAVLEKAFKKIVLNTK